MPNLFFPFEFDSSGFFPLLYYVFLSLKLGI